MANPIKNLEKRYDELVRDIIGHLKNLLADLNKEKESLNKERKMNIYDLYESKKMELLAKKNEVVENHKNKGGVTDEQKNNIIRSYEAFEKLIDQEMKLDKQDAVTYKSEQERVAEEIKAIGRILDYIKKNTGNSYKRFNLNTSGIQTEIRRVDKAIISRELEKKRTIKHTKLKNKINKEAETLLDSINKLLKQGQ